MKIKLTKRNVDALEATGKRYEISDDELPGFVVRVGKDGKKSFYYRYRAGKGRTALSQSLYLGSFPAITVEQARTLVRAKAAQVATGGNPAEDVRTNKAEPFFKDLAELFLTDYVQTKLKATTYKQYKALLLTYAASQLGQMKISRITHRHVTQLHTYMKATPYQANRCMAVLSKFFSWCAKNGYVEKNANPATGIERFKEHKRLRFMGTSEFEALGAAIARMDASRRIDPVISAVIKVLLFTGARLGEIIGLKWAYLDLDAGIAILPDSKTGTKPLYLPPQALAVLETLPRRSEYCFPGKASGHIVNIKDTWKRLLAEAKLANWRIHDLRHAFASVAASSGKSLPIIGKILGHTQAATTARYAHLADNPVAIAANETAATIQKALTSGKVVQFPRVSTGV
ncbi:MAG: tyrosine-type recombinase/integrase [Desulfovibrio sp.]|jgi:integrase|nr:tyrosine-type recombinase/integrase [Desulfovibrio sp.]